MGDTDSPIIPELDDVPEDDDAEPADAGVDNPPAEELGE